MMHIIVAVIVPLLPTLATILLSTALLQHADGLTPPWPYDGFDRFPTLWFGANATGLDGTAQLAFNAKHGIAGYGWQQGTVASGFVHGEPQLAQAALHLADYVAAHPPAKPTWTPTRVFVYRWMQLCWSRFDITRAAILNSNDSSLFLHDDDNKSSKATCKWVDTWSPPQTKMDSPFFLWQNPAATGFWLDNVISEVATEMGVDAVFFDETDWSYCGYPFSKSGCTSLSANFMSADYRAKFAALKGTAEMLNAAGKIPIFSTKNSLSASFASVGTTQAKAFGYNCSGVTLEEYAANLNNVSWIRFDEFWMSYQQPDADAVQIDTSIRLAAQGVGFIARAQAPSNMTCQQQIGVKSFDSSSSSSRRQRLLLEGSRHKHVNLHNSNSSSSSSSKTNKENNNKQFGVGPVDFNYALAAFLIVQSPYSYFGYSSDWYDDNWCWHSQYDISYGKPLAEARRTGSHSWTRNFTLCDVDIDTVTGISHIQFH